MRGPPDMKLVIDTVKPIMRSMQAQRQGDDVFVNWEVQEDNPDLGREGMRLEYSVKDAPIERWTPIPFTPALKGQAQFNPGHKRPLIVRLTVRDLAGNQSYGMAEVAGTVIAAGGLAPADAGTAVLPGQLILPAGPERKELPIAPFQGGTQLPKFPEGGGVIVPPPPPPPPSAHEIAPPPPVEKESPADKIVADSRFPPPPINPPKVAPPISREGQMPPTGGMVPALREGSPEKSIGTGMPATQAFTAAAARQSA